MIPITISEDGISHKFCFFNLFLSLISMEKIAFVNERGALFNPCYLLFTASPFK